VQRWPETKRLLGLLVNSSGGAHARNARRLVQAARKQDRRLQAALLAAALAHTPEAEEVLRGARVRLARKPSALARELLRNFPKGRRGRRRRGRRGKDGEAGEAKAKVKAGKAAIANGDADALDASDDGDEFEDDDRDDRDDHDDDDFDVAGDDADADDARQDEMKDSDKDDESGEDDEPKGESDLDRAA
jgi:hypothetical protein